MDKEKNNFPEYPLYKPTLMHMYNAWELYSNFQKRDSIVRPVSEN